MSDQRAYQAYLLAFLEICDQLFQDRDKDQVKRERVLG